MLQEIAWLPPVARNDGYFVSWYNFTGVIYVFG